MNSGRQLGQYEILSLISQGGMAAVYRARQTSIDREVAVKVIKTELARQPEFVARFQREAHMIATLSHAHILKVFDYGQQASVIYLVMELLRGGSLAEQIEAGPLALPQIQKLLGQISEALDYAHQKGVVHRDLKPHNVLLDEANNAFLSDFGLARLLDTTSALTNTGAVMGTPAYMAPEQFRGEALDARADVYALGIMLFEMLTGELPFQGDTPFALMYLHTNNAPPSLLECRPDLPAALQPVIDKALAKNKEDRFPSAGALAAAFNTILSGGRLPDATAAPVLTGAAVIQPLTIPPKRPVVQSTPPPPTQRYVIAGVIVVLVLIVGLIAVIGALRNNQTPSGPGITSGNNNSGVVIIITQPPRPTGTSTPVQTPTLPPTATHTRVPTNTPTPTNTRIPIKVPVFTPTQAQQSLTGKLAFVGQPGSQKEHGLWRLDSDNALSLLVTGMVYAPAWSRDGKFIAFSSNRRDSSRSEIYVTGADGSGLRDLVPNDDKGRYSTESDPAWSPNGKRILLVSDRDHQIAPRCFELYAVNDDGAALQQLTRLCKNDGDNVGHPSWSADGRQIAFAFTSDRTTNLYVMNNDGSNIVQLTNNAVTNEWPSWSPDGQWIAFASNRDGSFALYLMAPDGSGVHLLSSGSSQFTWSPDSKSLAVLKKNIRDETVVYMVMVDGSGESVFLDTKSVYFQFESPAWSP